MEKTAKSRRTVNGGVKAPSKRKELRTTKAFVPASGRKSDTRSRTEASFAKSDSRKEVDSKKKGKLPGASVKPSVSAVNKETRDSLKGRKWSKDSTSERTTKKASISYTNDSKTPGSRKVSTQCPQSTGTAKKEPRTELGQQVQSVLHGAIDVKCPINTKTIRIFISSTFTDTEHERNTLMEHVYPKLKLFCQARGYEFQAVDMRWGVPDAATNMHMTAELCLREIKACQQLSVGPNFVMLLSQKYGYCPLLPSIDTEEFEKLLSVLPDEESKEFTMKWYRLDENSIPAAYILQPVSTWIPEYFNEENESLRKEAQEEWTSQFMRLKDSLVQAAKVVFKDGREYHKYVQSVCEVEIDQGLMQDDNPARNCAWFHRQISGVNRTMSNECPEVARYLDVSGRTEHYEDPWDLQAKLKNRMLDILPSNNMEEYNVNWSKNGIDPKMEEHKKYLNQFCSDFQQKLQSMINDCIKEFKSAHINNPLYEEVVQHTLFCQKKVDVFHGRKWTLEMIRDYIQSNRRTPLIIHGRSGSGKTSVVAMAARSVGEWLDGKGRVFLRFLGTTPRSSTLRRLLVSVCQQIKFVYQVKAKIPQSNKGLVALFPQLLSSATSDNPIVVMFDALDQLNPDGGAQQLTWLPRTLPQNVKFIVSTLPDQQFRYFTRLSALFRDPECFVGVPDLPPDDVSNILAKWLKVENRTLQAHQMQVLRDAFAQCPLPLFLKISFDEACRWRSYVTEPEMRLQPTIRTAIDFLFQQVERRHGEVLVKHALGYLTAAVSGLTTNELEDILSCDDQVLNDVFQYWTPPMRRLPPLLWVRIRTSLSSYLVDREANGVRVICWYHRQFMEAARDRYLSDDMQRKRVHSAIADYFLGKNSIGVGAGENALIGGKYVRLASIPNQPLKLSDTKYNLRKLHELPHHLICSGRLDELKSEVLCNFHWLLSKIKAFSLRAVFDDFCEATATTNDPDISAVSETLQLAQDAILAEPNQFASQIVGRLYQHEIENVSTLVKVNLSETLAELVRQASNPPEPALIPSRAFLSPPGGQLVETLVGHTSSVYGLTATRNGMFAVTGSSKGIVKVWDTTDGNVLHSIEAVGEGIGAVKCCHDDQLIVVSSKPGIRVLSFETGEVLESLDVSYFDSSPPIALAGEGETTVILFSEKKLQVFDALSGKVLHKFISFKPVGQNCLLAAREDLVLCNSADDENSLKVISASTYRVSHSIKIFDTEDDEQFLHVTQIALKSTDEVLVAKKLRVDLYAVQSGEKLRSFQGKIDDWIKNLHVAPDEGFLIFPKGNKVAFLDLVTGERKDLLEHTDYTSRVVAVQNDLILTSAADNVVRTWDLTREDVPQEVGKPETSLRIYALPNDARHVVTVGRLGIDNYAATVWDLSSCLPVRKVSNITSNYLEIINERRAALRVGNRLAIVNLDTWKVVTVIKGKLPPHQFASTADVRVVNEGTELLTYSEDRKLLKIYNIETGDEVAELRPPRLEDEIRAFLVDPPGRSVVYICPKERGVLWDVTKRKLLFKANREKYYDKLTLSHAGFSPDGRYFVVSQRKTDERDYIRHPVVWDVFRGELAHDLRYEADTDTQSLTVMDNNRTISAHKDKNIVVWSLCDGSATQILQTSHNDCRIDVIGTSGNLAFSYTEKTIQVWDVEEGQQKASLTVDKVTAVHPIGEGRCVAVGCESVIPLVLLTLQGEGIAPYRFPEEGTKAIAGTEVDICFEGVDKFFAEDDG